jgi:hypothetical protein
VSCRLHDRPEESLLARSRPPDSEHLTAEIVLRLRRQIEDARVSADERSDGVMAPVNGRPEVPGERQDVIDEQAVDLHQSALDRVKGDSIDLRRLSDAIDTGR